MGLGYTIGVGLAFLQLGLGAFAMMSSMLKVIQNNHIDSISLLSFISGYLLFGYDMKRLGLGGGKKNDSKSV